jgi:hypothetical protein
MREGWLFCIFEPRQRCGNPAENGDTPLKAGLSPDSGVRMNGLAVTNQGV